MSKRAKYVPKHRHVAEPSPRRALAPAVRNGLAMGSVAAAVTGIAVAGGSLGDAPTQVAPTAQHVSGSVAKADGSIDPRSEPRAAAPVAGTLDRETVSRSAVRRAAKSSKASVLSADSGPARTASVDLSDGDPRDIARALMPQFGFGADQFGCLDSLWTRESNWSASAHNSSSGAHGIPQALPGSKMASAGPNWESNPVTQITWGLGYIQDRYGSPCGAWAHSEGHGWY
ncbi:lytic transglycosylase domain-containing protein [Nocardioides sp. MAH-18]|uniref:Lytic transglycosylase domain-containing protein n=1 Tax=Nocardioides agri TaxID=2682843 RepID=A0A6L6XNP9_9ACTN|nr:MULTISPECIES: lytic transglycosylase domain-containing protein [unclassified Nocardioides]MBA2954098.1 lytic transglycosylase domain-containing protein [Nocardioides sp. CGMCC 1.13656]MVQ48961.1 lytic transglycosylase domain-containing protein [Nocardioides sp. MAH-18]